MISSPVRSATRRHSVHGSTVDVVLPGQWKRRLRIYFCLQHMPLSCLCSFGSGASSEAPPSTPPLDGAVSTLTRSVHQTKIGNHAKKGRRISARRTPLGTTYAAPYNGTQLGRHSRLRPQCQFQQYANKKINIYPRRKLVKTKII